MDEVRFEYGAFGENLEKQANLQGYTLGKDAETLNKLMFSLNMVRIHGIITDSQADQAYRKLHKKVMQKLKRTNEKEEQ